MNRQFAKVLGANIDVVDWSAALSTIAGWAATHQSKYVCICNVHSVVTAQQDAHFMRVINNADMATSDGAPVAWMLRRLGYAGQKRISGPDLMWQYCALAAQNNQPIFLYGGMPEVLELLKSRLLRSFPTLRIAGAYSPPFRPLTAQEDADIVNLINESGAGTVWVSLGCPKQEIWMAEHKERIQAVMIGVGAAFDYHAEVIKRAPAWMQDMGLEWLQRLISEPGRLWRRYLVTNTLFILSATMQLYKHYTR